MEQVVGSFINYPRSTTTLTMTQSTHYYCNVDWPKPTDLRCIGGGSMKDGELCFCETVILQRIDLTESDE